MVNCGRWAHTGPKFGALTPFAPGDLRSAMGCALMGAWTCGLGRLNSGPLTPRTAFVDKPVPGAPSLLIRSRPRASGLVVEPEILAPARPLTMGLVQEKWVNSDVPGAGLDPDSLGPGG
jgi:hypothetical protein